MKLVLLCGLANEIYWSSNEGMKLSFALGFLLSHGERVSRSGSELSSKLFETVVFDLDLTIRVCSRERERESRPDDRNITL